MLNKIGQTEKDRYYMVSPIYMESKKAELTETETRILVAKGWRVGEMRRCPSKGPNIQL